MFPTGCIAGEGLIGRRLGEPRRPVQWVLLDRQRACQRYGEEGRGGNENQTEGRHQVSVSCDELLKGRCAGNIATAAKHDRAEDGDDDRATEQAEEI
jgi:hypothetical protein